MDHSLCVIFQNIAEKNQAASERQQAEAYAAICIALQQPRFWERWYDRAIDWVAGKLRHVPQHAGHAKFRQ